jgi:hypothetical protein
MGYYANHINIIQVFDKLYIKGLILTTTTHVKSTSEIFFHIYFFIWGLGFLILRLVFKVKV